MNPYFNFKIYGPYTKPKSRGRKFVIAYKKNNKITIPYSRYLIEISIGRQLDEDEKVHHIDGNVENNNLDNLKIVSSKEHKDIHGHPFNYLDIVEINCVNCNCLIQLTKAQARSRYYDEARGKSGPFCSSNCSGSFTNRDKKINLIPKVNKSK